MAADFFGDGYRFFRRIAYGPLQKRQSELFKKPFGLIFVNIHFFLYKSSGSAKIPLSILGVYQMKPIYQLFFSVSGMVALCFFLQACGQTAPFVDARREAGQLYKVGQSTPDRVAVCYRFWDSQREEILRMAEQECAKTGRIPVFDEKKIFNCRLVSPNTAFFRCVSPQTNKNKD